MTELRSSITVNIDDKEATKSLDRLIAQLQKASNIAESP